MSEGNKQSLESTPLLASHTREQCRTSFLTKRPSIIGNPTELDLPCYLKLQQTSVDRPWNWELRLNKKEDGMTTSDGLSEYNSLDPWISGMQDDPFTNSSLWIDLESGNGWSRSFTKVAKPQVYTENGEAFRIIKGYTETRDLDPPQDTDPEILRCTLS
jgi:hypothetical protein